MANDAGDADEGPNRFQNLPAIASAEAISADPLQILYRVDTAMANASEPLRIDFYRGDDGEEAAAFLGSDTCAATSIRINRNIVLTMPVGVSAMPAGATATDAEGHTSPLSLGALIFRHGFE
ncbi:MAG: hypothetical protein ABI650_10250 [Dokdonella sp.]